MLQKVSKSLIECHGFMINGWLARSNLYQQIEIWSNASLGSGCKVSVGVLRPVLQPVSTLDSLYRCCHHSSIIIIGPVTKWTKQRRSDTQSTL